MEGPIRWNLARYHVRRDPGAPLTPLDNLCAMYLPRSFGWLQSSLRWLELLIAAPKWTCQKVSERTLLERSLTTWKKVLLAFD